MLGKENIEGSMMMGAGGVCQPREYVSALQLLLKPIITYGKGRTR
jgi:hypothetical protein